MRIPVALLALLAQAAPAAAAPLGLGERLAPLKMKQASGEELEPASLVGRKAYVLAFIATRCPVSKAYDARLATFAEEYRARGVAVLGINSNRHESAAETAEHASRSGFSFPVLQDAGHAFADELGAQVTPEVFVFDADWALRYRGRIDDDRSGSAVASADLRAAVDALLSDQRPRLEQTQAFGCTIRRDTN